MQPNGVGFNAVEDLKSYTDVQDPFMIYDINENEQFVFKTSTSQMKIAMEMDEGGNHYLNEEYCHFDGNHKRVKTFVTITASVYHPLLRKQVVLATMNCKHEDSSYVAKFWRVFNDAFKKVNKTEKRFSPSGWVTDMASANFNGLCTIYGEDVLSKIKGCEFHYKQAVERKVKTLGENGEQFKTLALGLLNATTPEAYEHALKALQSFANDHPNIKIDNWIVWWNSRKENIFRAFTSSQAPRSNLAEVVHAGWKHRDRMGISLLECCYFDIRDSMVLAISLTDVESGRSDCGFGPSVSTREVQKSQRIVQLANQIGKDLLDFNITSNSGSSTKRKNPQEGGCYPPKRPKNIQYMLSNRITTAKTLENVMKLRKIEKISSLHRKFEVLSTESGRISYKVIICNTPSCTCPDFHKNGAYVLCKHLLFILMFVLKCQNKELLTQHIGDDDLKYILQTEEVEERFLEPSRNAPKSPKEAQDILLLHELYSIPQRCTLHHKKSRTAKCRGCKKVLIIGDLSVKVDGALTVPYGKSMAVPQIFYMCATRECFGNVPSWCNIKMPSSLFADDGISKEERDETVESLGVPCLSANV